MKRLALLSSLIVLLALAPDATASERGRPLIEHFPTGLHGGGPMHFSVEVLPDDRLAVANGQGLVLYDGVRWRLYRHPDGLLPLSSLAPTPDGRFCGGFPDDIGCYEPQPDGDFRWHSLSDRIDPAERVFGPVHSAHYDAARKRIWWVAYNKALFLELGSTGPVHVLHPAAEFRRGYSVGSEIWLYDTKGGLLRIVGDDARTEPVPGTESLSAAPMRIANGPDALMLLLVNGQLWRYAGGALTPVAQENWPQWAKAGPSSIARLRDGSYALGFRLMQPWIIDGEGRTLERYVESDGLGGDFVRGFAEDRQGGLWIAQHGGLWRIDRGSGSTFLGRESGLPQAEAIARWHGTLYVTSGTGLFSLVPGESGAAARFEPYDPERLGATLQIAVASDRFFAIARDLYVMDRPGETARMANAIGTSYVLSSSTFRPGRAFLSGMPGVFEVDASLPTPTLTLLPKTAATINNIAEQDADTLWLSNRNGGIWRIARKQGQWQPAESFADGRGLPKAPMRVSPSRIGVWAGTNKGLYRFDPARQEFAQPPGLPEALRTRSIFSVSEDDEGNIWVQTTQGTGVAWREGESWRWDEAPLAGLDPSELMLGVLREGPIVWVARTDGVARIDLDARLPLGAPALPSVARVDDLRRNVALPLGAGFGVDQRDLRFALAMPSHQRSGSNRFRTRLAGFDTDWSPWSATAERSYTRLPDGNFQLEVEGRDVYGRVATMTPYAFVLPAPWWRSGWAQAGYAALALLALWWSGWLGMRVRQRTLLARQRELEATVATRTAELADSNRELGEKNAQLADQAERLMEVDRLKTRFFVNVGHEFRTPLTLVLGPIEDLLRDAGARLSERVREQLELAHRNARRVLALIVEILDVNRLEHGKLAFRRERVGLSALVRRTLETERPLVERHGHTLVLAEEPGAALEVDVDPTQVERCLSNLVGNAAKYMARGGRIEVTLARADGAARLSVRDQGRGIAAAALPHVFDRFFQTEGGDEASGYGVGLALVREIVEGHGGRVAVESVLGEGSAFTLEFPLAGERAVAAAVEPAATAPAPGDTSLDAVVGDSASCAAAERERPLVLVVDDHDDLRLRLVQLFRDRFEVTEANDGPSAWRAATERLPDVIVCDVMMPGFDGIELTRRLRANAETAAISLLLLTAKAGSEHAVVGLEAGANDYLEKPFDSSELLARVEGLLAQTRRLRHQLARASASPEPAPVQETPEQRWRRRLDEVVEAKLDDSLFGVEELAQAVHGDRTTLLRRCKQQLGMSPSEYLRERRLARGRELLLRNAGNVSEVAYAVGFESLSSFTRAFSARYGEPPSAVRAARAAQAV